MIPTRSSSSVVFHKFIILLYSFLLLVSERERCKDATAPQTFKTRGLKREEERNWEWGWGVGWKVATEVETGYGAPPTIGCNNMYVNRRAGAGYFLKNVAKSE